MFLVPSPCRVICFMAQVSFHYFSAAFGDPFSPLLCAKLSDCTLIQFIDINHTCWERRPFTLRSTHCPNHISFTCKVLEGRLVIILDGEERAVLLRSHVLEVSLTLLFQERASLSYERQLLGTRLYGPVYISGVPRAKLWS